MILYALPVIKICVLILVHDSPNRASGISFIKYQLLRFMWNLSADFSSELREIPPNE